VYCLPADPNWIPRSTAQKLLVLSRPARDRRQAAPKLCADLHRAESLIGQPTNLVGAHDNFGAPTNSAFLSCSGKTGCDALGKPNALLLR